MAVTSYGLSNDSVTGTTTVAGTPANINISLGFYPICVEVWNPNTGVRLWWTDDMADGTANKSNPNASGITVKPTLSMHTTNKGNVNITAFTVQIAGVTKAVALGEKAITASKTVDKSKFGIFGFEVGVDGTVDSGKDTATFAYASAAAAIAAFDAIAPTAAHVRLGYLVVEATAAASYVSGTNTLDQANSVSYYGGHVITYLPYLGITPYDFTSVSLSAGTTVSGAAGFIIGLDTDLQKAADVLLWRAYR